MIATLVLATAFCTTGPHDNEEDQFRGIWYCSSQRTAEFAAMGFNFVYMPTWDFDPGNGRLRANAGEDRKKMMALAARDGFDYAENLGTLAYHKFLKENFQQLRHDGSKLAYTDMSNPEVREICRRQMELDAGTIPRDDPHFAGVAPCSEVRDKAIVNASEHLKDAWAKYSGGKPMPVLNGDISMPPHYSTIDGFPASRIVDERDPVFDFYRWFWREGDGWNGYCSDVPEIYGRVVGRTLFTFFDPAVRTPPIWGSGGAVTHLNNWTYVYPDPYGISFVTACCQAMARGRGQRVMEMIQAISYRSQLAPKGVEPQGPKPEWLDRLPDAVYMTTPPDLAQEAMWTLFSHKLDGILFHGWQSIADPRGAATYGYEWTNPHLETTISNLFTGVGRELGPLFKALPETGRTVAYLESSAAWLFAKRGGYGYIGGPYSDPAEMATLAGLSPYVLYDEEIERDGIPTETRILLMPNCDVLTKRTYEAVKAFQWRGGIVFADGNLAPAILPDELLPVHNRVRKAATDVPAMWREGAQLKALAKKYLTLDADVDRSDMFVRLRRMRGGDYLFAINDRRCEGDYVGQWKIVWEKGLPNRGRVSVRRAAGAVYDLAKHAPVPFEVKDGQTFIDVTYETNDGRVFLVADRPLGPLEVVTQSGEVYVRSDDADLMIPIRVETKGRKPFYGVIRGGTWVRGFDGIEDVRVTNLADGKTYRAGGDKLQAEIDRKKAEEAEAERRAIPPDRETYLFKTMKHAFPKLRKIGAVSPYGECSPFVFKGRLMRMELADPSRGRDAKNDAICAVIRDVETGRIVGRTGEGCYYQSASVEGDTVYITATKRIPGRNDTCGDTILLFESKDLVNWTSRELLSRPGWNFYNSTLTKGPDGYVIALESDNLKHARRYFTMFFATSKDLRTWTFLPDEKAYPKHRYCGGPFLKYVDGWYYLSLVTEMPCERWCTYLFRTKDFSEWESGRYNPMLMWSDEDRRVAEKSADITPELAERIRTGFVCNASDAEFCEFKGRTCIDYLVGDQRGFYFMAEAWYDGSLKEFLERQFE